MARRSKIKRIAFVRRQATLLANLATYFECERMTEAEFLANIESVEQSLKRERERKEKENGG